MKKRAQTNANFSTATLEVKGQDSLLGEMFDKPEVRRKKSSGVKFDLPKDDDPEMSYLSTAAAGLDEVTYVSPRGKVRRGQLAKTDWNPAKGIKSFNLDDLPSLATLAGHFKDDVSMSRALEGVLAEPKTVRGSSVGGVKNKVTKKSAESPRGDKDTVFGTTSDRLRGDLLKVSAQIKGDLQTNIGFGFRNVTKSKSAGIPLGGTAAGNSSEKSKMVDKSITSLQSRIQEQRRKFQEYQAGSLKLPARSITSTGMPPTAKLSAAAGQKAGNFLLRKKAQENAKLNEIARIFRQSLESSARDPNEVIRLPGREKSPAKNPSQVTKGSVVTKTAGVGKPFLGKPKALTSHSPRLSSGLIELRQLLHRGGHNFENDQESSLPSTIPHPLDFAKKKIEELEQPIAFRRGEKKAPSLQFAEYLDEMNKETKNPTVGKVSKSPRKSNVGPSYSTAVSPEVFQKKLSSSVKTLEEAGAVAKNVGSLMTRVASVNSRSPRQSNPGSPASGGVRARDLAKNMGLKFDVSTILKSKSPREQQTQMLKLTEEMNNILSPMKVSGDDGFNFPTNDALFQPKKPVKPKHDTDQTIPAPQIGGTRTKPTGGKVSTSTGTGPRTKAKTIEVQTDDIPGSKVMSPSFTYQPLKFMLPEIEFTKDMSEKDQEMLKDLRAMRSKWGINKTN